MLYSQGILTAQEVAFESKFPVETLENAPVKIIPFPQEVTWGEGQQLFEDVAIDETGAAAGILAELDNVLKELGIPVAGNSESLIRFVDRDGLEEEAYTLRVTPGGIEIGAATAGGQFYALQTLRQLSPKPGALQLASIEDAPAFGLRGFMIDVGRNFQSLEALKQQLDIMARYKLNTFHWHLTDRPAWRIESKLYPELTAAENHRPTRDPGKFYTYEEIRELIRYADSLQIDVIPEIDMPGHSDSFVTALGHKMESPEGMDILEELLEEFFKEIPKEMAPLIHIGSDEVEIPNPVEFMDRMVGFIEDHGREVIIWNPGLPVGNSVIRQTWKPQDTSFTSIREIDSWNSYINNGEPMTLIPKLFFKPIGEDRENEVLGGILALWEDVNIEEQEDIFLHNPVYPALLTYAWATWTADVQQASEDYLTMVPSKNSPEHEYFAAYEDFLIYHKNNYFKQKPFQYVRQADALWKLAGPFEMGSGPQVLENPDLEWKEAVGNTVIIRDRFKQGGYYPEAKPGEAYYAVSYIQSDTDKKVPFWIGFETPLRANRTTSGIPEQGNWDANGGDIWLNGQNLPAPEWENPNWKPEKREGWPTAADREIPWGDEELYWTREPVEVPLNKGWNEVIVKVPGTHNYQNWMFTFAPLEWEGLEFSIEKPSID